MSLFPGTCVHVFVPRLQSSIVHGFPSSHLGSLAIEHWHELASCLQLPVDESQVSTVHAIESSQLFGVPTQTPSALHAYRLHLSEPVQAELIGKNGFAGQVDERPSHNAGLSHCPDADLH